MAAAAVVRHWPLGRVRRGCWVHAVNDAIMLCLRFPVARDNTEIRRIELKCDLVLSVQFVLRTLSVWLAPVIMVHLFFPEESRRAFAPSSRQSNTSHPVSCFFMNLQNVVDNSWKIIRDSGRTSTRHLHCRGKFKRTQPGWMPEVPPL